MSDQLDVSCHHCGNAFTVDDAFGGEVIFCPKCFRMLRAPRRGQRGVTTAARTRRTKSFGRVVKRRGGRPRILDG